MIAAEKPPTGDRYRRHWAVFWCLVTGLGLWALYVSRPPSYAVRPPQVPLHGVDWFLVIKLPEVPNDPVQAETAKTQLADWLTGLTEAGFQPMALSTVLSWLDQGSKLPPKTVVLVFYPGYRRTYEALAPIFVSHACPAVWLTDRDALRLADHRYVSYRVIEKMRASHVWDLGWFSEAAHPQQALAVQLEGLAAQGALPHQCAFEPRVGDAALNRGRPTSVVHHLRVHPAWTTQELVDRLLVEAPVEGPSHLMVREIGARPWGAAVEARRSRRPQWFDLQAPLQARAASVSWPSTMGKSDCTLYLQLTRGVGECWFLLRSDRSVGDAVRVGFVEDLIIVEQDTGGDRVRLAAVQNPLASDSSLVATITLTGQHLDLSMGKRRILQLDSLKPTIDAQGMVELVLSDKVRGAAEIKSASLFFTPLPQGRAEGPLMPLWRLFQLGRKPSPPPGAVGSRIAPGAAAP